MSYRNWCFWTAVLEKTLESPLDSKEIQPVNPRANQPRISTGRTDTETPNTLGTGCKNCLTGKDWCWERLKAGGDGDSREWDGWMASLTRWTWVWASSNLVMDREALHAAVHGSQRVGHDWATELNCSYFTEEEKLSDRKIKSLLQGHTVRQCKNQIINMGSLISDSAFLLC